MRDPESAGWKINAVRQHIERGPVEGVYELDNVTADRVIADGTPAALDAEIAAIDASRTKNPGGQQDQTGCDET